MIWLFEKLTLDPDLSRAVRAASAFGGALIICVWTGHPEAIPFAATAAQVMESPQFRGAYGLRLLVLLAMILVFAGSALLGGVTGNHLPAAVASIGFLSLLGGLWRYLSTDYGQPMTVDSALFFLLAVDRARDWQTDVLYAWWVALGAAGGALLQIGLWFFRPQHSLRHAVAECWIAASELFSAMQAAIEAPSDSARSQIVSKQGALREILDRTMATLEAANPRHREALLAHLTRAHRAAARFAMQVVAFRESLEPLAEHSDFADHAPAFAAALETLANMARSSAVTLVGHRQANLENTKVRLERSRTVLHVLEEHLVSPNPDHSAAGHARTLLRALEGQLPQVRDSLMETVDQSAGGTIFPFRLPNLTRRSMRALAAGLNPASGLNPALVRYALRMAVLTMFAVAAYLHFHIPRGYWMAFAIVVVLQPDYGATRKRAAERVLGTLGGALVGSALLYAPLPHWVFGTLAVTMVFAFGYYLKRHYAVAVFFVTLMLVLVTESVSPVHIDFTIGRLLSNAAGSALAFIAALIFWPTWERDQFPAFMAEAIRRNARYLRAVGHLLATGHAFSGDAPPAKREAEQASNLAAASLQRMLTEPLRQQENASQAAALVASNQRVTNAITVLAAQLRDGHQQDTPAVQTRLAATCESLEQIAQSIEHGQSVPLTEIGHPGEKADKALPPQSSTFSILKISAEVRALELARWGKGEIQPTKPEEIAKHG